MVEISATGNLSLIHSHYFFIQSTPLLNLGCLIILLLAYRRANWVKVEGTTYKSPCTVVLRVDDGYPVFGHLKGIYIINDNVTLHVRVAETIRFDEHPLICNQGYQVI